MTQDAAQARKGAGLSVAGWPLGRKMALALAIPLLLAAVLGGLRVAGDYGDSRQAELRLELTHVGSSQTSRTRSRSGTGVGGASCLSCP